MSKSRKQQILETGYEILGREGIEGLHARSVAAELGVNHAGVHYYFATRADLLTAICEYALGRFAQDRDLILGDAEEPTERIEGHLAQAEAYCKPQSRFFKVWTSLFLASQTLPAIRAELVRHFREWGVVLELDLRAATQQGAIRPESPFKNGDLLSAALLGLIGAAHTVGADFPYETHLDTIAASLFVPRQND
jgi:AcrR family transcriptional regulator